MREPKKPVAKPTDPIDEPTRTSVERLFSMLTKTEYDIECEVKRHSKIVDLEQAIQDRRDELEKDKQLQDLIREKEKVSQALTLSIRETSEAAKKVEKVYYARGLTPKVKEMVAELTLS